MRIAIAALLALFFAARSAHAHDFNPGVLALAEISPGRFTMVWTEPVDSSGAPGGVRAIFPPECRAENGILDCSPHGLAGTIVFEGMHENRMQVVIAIEHLDGRIHETVVSGTNAKLEIERRPTSFALSWLEIGARHIAGGLDHLAFVLGLLLVVSRAKELVATVTAFTLAHSFTLAMATLGWLRLPALPVEAAIAASIVLVAREATHDEPTWTRRMPWAVALIFGLIHGLGFAGALQEMGLPRKSFGWALFWFNVGVELAQLALIGGVLVVARFASERIPRAATIKRAACYAIGAFGAWLFIERVVALITARS